MKEILSAKNMRSFAIAVTLCAVFHALFLLRNNYPFNELIRLRAAPSYLEWIGLLFILYIVPTIVYFLLMPEREFHDLTSRDRTTTFAVFAGATLILGFLGLVVGCSVGFVIGIIFYGIK